MIARDKSAHCKEKKLKLKKLLSCFPEIFTHFFFEKKKVSKFIVLNFFYLLSVHVLECSRAHTCVCARPMLQQASGDELNHCFQHMGPHLGHQNWLQASSHAEPAHQPALNLKF